MDCLIHLRKTSFRVSKYQFCLALTCKGPKMSMLQTWKGVPVCTLGRWTLVCLGLLWSFCWQGWHSLMVWETSGIICSINTRCLLKWYIATTPACPRNWWGMSIALRQRRVGTKSRECGPSLLSCCRVHNCVSGSTKKQGRSVNNWH